MDQYIKDKMINTNKYYLFFDEIQYVEEWERVINSYKAKCEDKISIFITGSNSDLLSGELSTLLSGRYVSFKINPFSFKEVCNFKNYELDKYQLEEAFNNYVKWGGLPQRFNLNNEYEIRIYLTDVYNSIVVKDIINRFNVTNLELFNRIVEYVVTTPSQTFSVENLVKYFEINDDRGVGKTTLYNYLEYIYYLTDLGLGQILNISKKEQTGAYLENIVYNELVYRGYDVKIGNLDNG